MGEMADYYAEQEIMNALYGTSNFTKRGGNHMKASKPMRYTEEILNAKTWVTGDGEILEVSLMEKSHLHNTLFWIYKNRDRYWLNCRNAELIEQFVNGDDFFHRVIRVSTLWVEIITALTEVSPGGFNFEIDMGGTK